MVALENLTEQTITDEQKTRPILHLANACKNEG